jgi:hypothetical protein
MPTQRVLRSVTKNFLGTYTSRYSDRQGAWLWGFLCGGPDLDIDLLGSDRSRNGSEPAEDARVLALERFADQLAKVHFRERRLKDARLSVVTLPPVYEETVRTTRRKGHIMSFRVSVTTDLVWTCEASCGVFVAPYPWRSTGPSRKGCGCAACVQQSWNQS